MKREVLIDAIVRQTTVLIAQLATATGARAPLAHTANQVFLDLVTVLKDQGMTHAVIADMFGMALRSYHKRVRRLSESATYRGQSTWSAVLNYVQENGPCLRTRVLQRFANDDDVTVRGVLSDMVDAGVLYAAGQGDATVYRAMDAAELPRSLSQDPERLAHMVWVSVYRFGPSSLADLQRTVPAESSELSEALERLVADGRIEVMPGDGPERYSCDRCFIPVGSDAGQEAAIFDHYQAVVTTIAHKLHPARTQAAGETGGSTYRFTVWQGHPHRQEVATLLSRLRAQVVALREQVEVYNQDHDAPAIGDYEHFVSYLGQTALERDEATGEPASSENEP